MVFTILGKGQKVSTFFIVAYQNAPIWTMQKVSITRRTKTTLTLCFLQSNHMLFRWIPKEKSAETPIFE